LAYKVIYPEDQD